MKKGISDVMWLMVTIISALLVIAFGLAYWDKIVAVAQKQGPTNIQGITHAEGEVKEPEGASGSLPEMEYANWLSRYVQSSYG